MASKQWPKVLSRHHKHKHCGPCFICKKEQPRYTLTIRHSIITDVHCIVYKNDECDREGGSEGEREGGRGREGERERGRERELQNIPTH